MHLRALLFSGLGLVVAPAWAQLPTIDAETRALAAVRAQRTDGLIAVQPWIQPLGPGRLGVGWLTAQPADGVVEWTQSGTDDTWQPAWFAEDGLRQANGVVQRAVIEGYDPARPIRLRARSRAITSFEPYSVSFSEPAVCEERRLPPSVRPRGAVSFLVFNDVHNHVALYPLFMEKLPQPIDFIVFNGDVLQDPQTESDLTDNLLLPMAWFASKSIPVFFLRGNHETRGAFARLLKPYLLLPENRYYAAMTFGAARVLFLDTGEDKPDANKEYSGLVDFDPYIEQQATWLKLEIASEAFQQAAWRLVVMHIPPDWRRAESHLGHGERRVRQRFVPLLDAGRIDAVISGHNHLADTIAPCPDRGRGFQWPVFIGGASALTNATAFRIEADTNTLKITRLGLDGQVGVERTWTK